MEVNIPKELIARASDWNQLHPWERRELGVELRFLGLSYGEIQSLIPVPKSTLSTWLNSRRLPDAAVAAIRERTDASTRRGIPVDTQWRRRQQIDTIRSDARAFALANLADPVFVSGVTMYWGEGSKTRNFVDLTNTDPAALRLFIRWVREYLDSAAEFQLGLHLHAMNNEMEAKEYWRFELGLPHAEFGKTYLKPAGTGHRKNHLRHGVCRVRTRRAADNWHRVMTSIDVVRGQFGVISNPDC
jgi:hypothetical protein